MCGCESRDRSAAYAVPALACDASMTLMLVGGRFGGVTFVHVLPLSRVTWIKPVLAPTHITPAVTGERARVVIDPPGAGAPTPPAGAPASGGGPPGGAARSRLIVRQVSPRSVDASTCCAAMYIVCGSPGENASGGAPPTRPAAVGWFKHINLCRA